MERCFETLASVGAGEFVVVVGYMAEMIIERYGDEYHGRPITYARQRERKGLAHALLQAEQYAGGNFLLMHGDNVFAPSASNDLNSIARSDADAALSSGKCRRNEPVTPPLS
jgi:glucose-1-phosphate thymidylyltransferase